MAVWGAQPKLLKRVPGCSPYIVGDFPIGQARTSQFGFCPRGHILGTVVLTMTKRYLLGDLGHIWSGYSYRSAKDLEPKDDPNYQAVQLNALTEDGQIDWSKLEPIRFDGNPDLYLLHPGDVMFPLRGSRASAVVVRDPPDDALAVGHWAVLTPDPKKVDGAYIAWYWNHPDVSKRREYEMSKGSNIQFISMRDCRSFMVELPSLACQQQISRVADLRRQERELVQRIELLKDKLVSAATMQAVAKS